MKNFSIACPELASDLHPVRVVWSRRGGHEIPGLLDGRVYSHAVDVVDTATGHVYNRLPINGEDCAQFETVYDRAVESYFKSEV